ncbi:MAG TPA: high-affinity branched-chain amino acid ABC transporter permease LivM [Alphaproteobacteria bacterium]|nr:high-affinity branched-chain amino acid ABC transporter permease LivM [Alphaproteobacteria bacterium]
MATIVERRAAPSFLAAGLKESALAAFVALMLAFPMLGFHLVDIPGGVTVQARWSWVVIAVVAVFIGRFLLVLLRQAHPKRFAKAFSFSLPRPSRIPLNDLIGALLAVFALALPFLPFSDRYIIDISISVLIYVMLGWGLNIVVGLAGLLDLGYVAFYAVGAYSFALLSQHFGLGFWECLPLAGAFAAMFGILLGFPVLRLRGDYLAIVTLGFGEMIRIILLNWQQFTGGPNGLSAIPRPSFFGFPFARSAPEGTTTFHQLFGIEFDVMHRTYFLYYVILMLALLTNFFSMRIRKLPVGRAWEALREDEIACRSLGINPTNTKLSAFAIGAMFGGFAGSFFATRQGFISPESFTFPESATILAIVVLGGLGSQLGVVIAAAFLVLAPEFLRDFAQFRMLAFGAAMVAVMVWRPQGLVSHRDPTISLRPAGGSAP